MKNPKTITLKVTEHQWAIARAIAVMYTAKNWDPREPPFTAESILQYALIEAMIDLEKKELGTNSLDYAIRRPGEKSTGKGLRCWKTSPKRSAFRAAKMEWSPFP